jgi:hypothetical protein
VFHHMRGTPFGDDAYDEGSYKSLTQWEQIDGEMQFTVTRKFYSIIPIILCVVGVVGGSGGD